MLFTAKTCTSSYVHFIKITFVYVLQRIPFTNVNLYLN